MKSICLLVILFVVCFGHSVGAEQGNSQWAVIIVDMQSFFLSKIKPEKKEQLIAKQKEVISFCSKKDIPIIILEYKNKGLTVAEILKKAEKVSRKRVIVKSDDNGFQESVLLKQLLVWGVKNILITGINSCCCVKETADNAQRNGLLVATSADLITDYKLERHNKDLDWYKSKCVFYPNVSRAIEDMD